MTVPPRGVRLLTTDRALKSDSLRDLSAWLAEPLAYLQGRAHDRPQRSGDERWLYPSARLEVPEGDLREAVSQSVGTLLRGEKGLEPTTLEVECIRLEDVSSCFDLQPVGEGYGPGSRFPASEEEALGELIATLVSADGMPGLTAFAIRAAREHGEIQAVAVLDRRWFEVLLVYRYREDAR